MRQPSDDPSGEWMDRLLTSLACFFLGTLLLVQAVLSSGEARLRLSLPDRLEGEKLGDELPAPAKGLRTEPGEGVVRPGFFSPLRSARLEIRAVEPDRAPGVRLTINGAPQGTFDRGMVAVTVREGDYAELDARGFSGKVRFVVTAEGIWSEGSLDGLLLETTGDIVPIGKIRVRR